MASPQLSKEYPLMGTTRRPAEYVHTKLVNLPTVQGLGQFGGFDMWLQDRSGAGYEQLTQARNILLGKAAQKPEALVGVRPNGLENAPQLQLHVDRVQARLSDPANAAIAPANHFTELVNACGGIQGRRMTLHTVVATGDPATDYGAVEAGLISVTPVRIDLTARDLMTDLSAHIPQL